MNVEDTIEDWVVVVRIVVVARRKIAHDIQTPRRTDSVRDRTDDVEVVAVFLGRDRDANEEGDDDEDLNDNTKSSSAPGWHEEYIMVLLIERMEYPTRRAKQRGIYSNRQWLPTDHNLDVWIHRIFFVVVYVWSVMRRRD